MNSRKTFFSRQRQVATFGGGCFWCIEAVFSELKGVEKVESGYSGGTTAYPTYEQVSTGTTGHAEVVQINFDPKIISFKEIMEQTEISQNDEGVFVKPSVVVEVTYQEIQETDEYTSGYALRVPKVVRFRPDKKVEEIDNVGKLHKLYELQYERHPFQSL